MFNLPTDKESGWLHKEYFTSKQSVTVDLKTGK